MRRTAIDQLIRPEQRLAANSLLGTCFQLGQSVIGPAVSAHDAEQTPFTRDSFELVQPAVLEFDSRAGD